MYIYIFFNIEIYQIFKYFYKNYDFLLRIIKYVQFCKSEYKGFVKYYYNNRTNYNILFYESLKYFERRLTKSKINKPNFHL